jgi:diguanylate cyclase (GGDEF)-like protein/PAS domain S-box-containing protein
VARANENAEGSIGRWGRPLDPLEAAVEAIDAGMVIVDRDGELLVLNQAASELLGDGVSWVLGQAGLRGWRVTQPDNKTPVRHSELPLSRVLQGASRAESQVIVHERGKATIQLALSARPIRGGGAVLTITDVTERRLREEQAREAEERFRLTFEGAPVGMALVGLGARHGALLQVNSALCSLTGRDVDELLKMKVEQLVASEQDIEIARRLFSGETVSASEQLQFRQPDDTRVWVQAHTSIVRGATDANRYAILQVEDFRLRRRYEERLRHLADHDPLTGLLNRRRFHEAIAAHRQRCERYGADGAIVLIDLDGFKDVNDTLGHSAGDDHLRAIAATLLDRVRTTDVLARLGGDEFAVLLTSATSEDAAALAAELVSRVAATEPDGQHVDSPHVSATAGIAMFAGEKLELRDVLAEADVALYEAKSDQRGQAVLYTPQGQQRLIAQRMSWSERIRTALEDDHGFVLFSQPIHDYASGRVTRHELLLRLRDGTGELAPPDRFLPVAEQMGAMRRIDLWVLARAIALLGQRPDLEEVLINVSAASLTDSRFIEDLEELVSKSQVDPARLTLEITETTALAHLERARVLAARLRQLGCRLALDDFGAGFASFIYLKHLRVDILKIDGEFVRDIAHDATSEAVVRAIVQTAAVVGSTTIAECVESAEGLALLEKLGVDAAQGYYIGRPVALETPAEPAA